MFPQPGSVSVFSSFHSLVVFFFYLFKWIFIIVSAAGLLELVFVLFCRSNVKTMPYITDGVDGQVGIVK